MLKKAIFELIERKYQQEYQQKLKLNYPLNEPYEGLDMASLFGLLTQAGFTANEQEIQMYLNELLSEKQIKTTGVAITLSYTSIKAIYP